MVELKIGDIAPAFCLKDKDGKDVCLDDFKGRHIVLYFYPKDGSKGCTQQAKDFNDAKKRFDQMNVDIIGVSPDPPSSHAKFVEKNSLEIKLLSDEGSKVSEGYGVWQKKSMYGKEFMGVVRSTFIIGPEGTVKEAWYKVKVPDHVDMVLAKVSCLLA